MKITSIEILLIKATLDIKGKDGLPRPWRPIVVKVNTDEGISGFGEVALAYGRAFNAGAGAAKDMAAMVIGMDPMNTELIWDRMMKKTFWGQAGGAVFYGGMSAIDMACWDIKGKALGVPLYQLLGGKTNDNLRCYASQLQFDWGTNWIGLTTPEQYAEAALKAVAEGYDAIKVDLLEYDMDGNMKMINLDGVIPQPVVRMGVQRLEAIRKAIGPDVDIIIENHGETDVTSAIQFARAIEPYNIMYYEEVNTPLNAKLGKFLKDKINIPLAGGERVFTRYQYVPVLENRTLDLIQPDLGTCGGITEAKKICDMAHAYEVVVQTHVCASPICKAASLHLEAAIPNFCIHEHHRMALMQGNKDLCVHDYQPENGKYKVPELPGIGQELTDYAYKLADREVVD